MEFIVSGNCYLRVITYKIAVNYKLLYKKLLFIDLSLSLLSLVYFAEIPTGRKELISYPKMT